MSVETMKVVIVGAKKSGKTELVGKMVRGSQAVFNEEYEAMISARFSSFLTTVEQNINVRVQICDTTGQERYSAIIPIYAKNDTVGILVLDGSKGDQDLGTRFETLEQYYGKLQGKAPVILVITKADSDVELLPGLEERAKAFAEENNLGKVHKVSSKDNIGIEELTADMIKRGLEFKDSLRAAPEDQIEILDGVKSEVSEGISGYLVLLIGAGALTTTLGVVALLVPAVAVVLYITQMVAMGLAIGGAAVFVPSAMYGIHQFFKQLEDDTRHPDCDVDIEAFSSIGAAK